MSGFLSYINDPFFLTMAVLIICAIAIAAYVFYKYSKKSSRQRLFVIGNVDIEDRKPDRDQFAARDDRTSEAWFIDGAAYRRRASGNRELVQFVPARSATPLFPGMDRDYRDARIKENYITLTKTAIKAARHAESNIDKLRQRMEQHQTYKYAIIGTVIIVLVVSSVILLVTK